jgi:hypothetical protein
MKTGQTVFVPYWRITESRDRSFKRQEDGIKVSECSRMGKVIKRLSGAYLVDLKGTERITVKEDLVFGSNKECVQYLYEKKRERNKKVLTEEL